MDTSDAKLVADVVINLFAAGSLLIIAHSLLRASPKSAVYQRVRFALWLGASLFAIRAIAWWTNSSVLGAIEIGLAAASPIAGLILAEGLLRRHAPFSTKLIVVSATVVALIANLLPGLSPSIKLIVLLLAVGGSLLAIAALLLAGIRKDLDREERVTAGRVLGSLLIVMPCIATDFGALFPEFPVRIGALSIVFLLYISFGAGSTSNKLYERTISIVVFILIALAFALAHQASQGETDTMALLRAVAVGFSGLLFAALFSELMGARSERRRSAGAYLRASDYREFAEDLREDGRMADTHRLTPSELAPLRHASFEALLEEHPLLRRVDAPWSKGSEDPGAERAMSLLKTYNATHIMRIATQPLELFVLAVPPEATDPRFESEFLAAQRIGELLYARKADA